MGKLTTVVHEGSEVTLSLIKWSGIRRLMLSLTKPRAGMPALFVPQYEIAVFDGPQRAVFSGKPWVVFYFPDYETAVEKWNEIEKIVEQGGLYNLASFIRDGNPRKQGVLPFF